MCSCYTNFKDVPYGTCEALGKKGPCIIGNVHPTEI